MNSIPGLGGEALPPTVPSLVVTAGWPLRCGVVPTLADRFNPRPETGPDLLRALQRSAIVALIPQSSRSGLAPVSPWLRNCGKTQLAAAFAESQWRARAIDLLMWVDASSAASLLSGYVDAAMALTGERTGGAATRVAASLVAWLGGTDRRWLLVLDDVPDGSILPGLLPAGQAGHVVITGASARVATGLPDAAVVEIGPYSPREAMTYLMSRLAKDPDQRRGAMDLIRDLSCQPAALAQSTAAIASSWITCTDYCEKFHRRQVLIGAPGEQSPAAVTWTLALDEADQQVPGGAARYSLVLAAMLDGHGIPAGLFGTAAAREFITPDAGSVSLPGQPSQLTPNAQLALTSLQHLGLVSLDTAGDLTVIRLSAALQRSVNAAISPDLLGESAAAAAAALQEFWPEGARHNAIAQLLRAGATALLRAGGDALWAGGCPDVLTQAGRSLTAAGMPAAAVDYWRELSAVSDRLLGPAHPDSLALADQLADCLSAAGLKADAIALRQRIADDRARTFGPQHSLTLAAQVNFGRSLIEAGEFSTAIAVLATALQESGPRRGSSDPEVLAIRDELAAAYIAAGRTGDAIGMLKITLGERARSKGPAHPDTIAARQRLAAACLTGGQLKDAVSQYRQAVVDSERVNGSDHRETLRARGALAAAYEQTGKIANAVSMYELTRDGCTRALGPDDPDTLSSCVSLAQMYNALGHLANATALLRDTLERCERVLPPGDPITMSARDGLATIVGN